MILNNLHKLNQTFNEHEWNLAIFIERAPLGNVLQHAQHPHHLFEYDCGFGISLVHFVILDVEQCAILVVDGGRASVFVVEVLQEVEPDGLDLVCAYEVAWDHYYF